MSRFQRLMLNLSTGDIPDGIADLFDGVANLKAETVSLATVGCTIWEGLATGRETELEEKISNRLRRICQVFHPKPVWYRTTDVDSYVALQLGLPVQRLEHPHLPARGLTLALKFPEGLRFEIGLVSQLCAHGISNLGIKFPMVGGPEQIHQVMEIMRDMGVSADLGLGMGVTIETPCAALRSAELVECGLQFATVGIADLGTLAYGIDRENLLGIDIDYFNDPGVTELARRASAPFLEAGLDCILSGLNSLPPEAALRLAASCFTGVAVQFTNADRVLGIRRRIEELSRE